MPLNGQIHDLAMIRDSLKPYVTNDRTQYYAAFKAKFGSAGWISVVAL